MSASTLPAPPASPLHTHPAFRTTDFDTLAGVLETQLGAEFARLPVRDQSIEACANRIKLPVGELWFCSYGMPLSVKFPDADCIRVQVQHAGVGATWVGSEMVGVTETQACISEGATEIDFGQDFQQVVWRAPRGALVRKLSMIHDAPVTSDLEFEPVLDLAAPAAAPLKHILRGMIESADSIEREARGIVLSELEQAFVVSLLAASRHTHRGLMTRRAPSVAPWQVRRAEGYIEANWAQAITIDDLVAATEVSARTLFRTFRQHRGCTPLEFARRVRLDHAREMIARPDSGSITEIALICGFGDPSQFSKSFAQAFGESPSAARKRQRERAEPVNA